jgi:hypothetical protein
MVTGQMLMIALDMARKMGIGGKEVEEFADAWRELNRAKSKAKAKGKRTTTVTVEEEVELRPEGNGGEVIDVTPVNTPADAEWSEEELRLLEAPKEAGDDGRA